MRRLAAFAVAVCLLGVCGFASPVYAGVSSTGTPVQTGTARCPVGVSAMGCSVTPARTARLAIPTPSIELPTGQRVPDVSSYQPNVDWAQVKAWQILHGWKIQGGIFKLGENVADPYALTNATGLHKLGMIAIGYWFIRPSGATEEAGKILAEASVLHIHVIALDEEVPGIQGYAAVIAPILRKAGYTVVDYHSAGNVLDTSAAGLLCWVAAYGPLHPPRCTTGKRVGWQFTGSGTVPGVIKTVSVQVDISISYGLLRLAVPPKPKPVVKPKPMKLICFGPGTTPPPAKCVPIVAHHAWLVSRRIHWGRVTYSQRTHKSGSAYKTAAHWYFLRRGQAVKLRAKYASK